MRDKPGKKGYKKQIDEPEAQPLSVMATGVNKQPKKPPKELENLKAKRDSAITTLKNAIEDAKIHATEKQKEKLTGVTKCLNSIRNMPANKANKEAFIKRKLDTAKAIIKEAMKSGSLDALEASSRLKVAEKAILEYENNKPDIAKSESIFPDGVEGVNKNATKLSEVYDGVKNPKPIQLGTITATVKGESLQFGNYERGTMTKQAADLVINMGKRKDGPIVVTGPPAFQHDLLEKCFEQGMATEVKTNFKMGKFSTKSIPEKRDAKAFAALINATPTGDASEFGIGKEGAVRKDAQTLITVINANGDGTTSNKAIEKMAEKRYKNDPEGAANLVKEMPQKIQDKVAKHIRKGLEASGMKPDQLEKFDKEVGNKGPDQEQTISVSAGGGRK